ncbi:regulatory protein GemA, partial [Yersinia enterocolitica]|nr:regulatory protein GemA [Yersinia enterocolitica]
MDKKLIQLIHVGKSALAWDDETYRDVIYRLTGKT